MHILNNPKWFFCWAIAIYFSHAGTLFWYIRALFLKGSGKWYSARKYSTKWNIWVVNKFGNMVLYCWWQIPNKSPYLGNYNSMVISKVNLIYLRELMNAKCHYLMLVVYQLSSFIHSGYHLAQPLRHLAQFNWLGLCVIINLPLTRPNFKFMKMLTLWLE